MIALLGKGLFAIIEHELQKQSPNIEQYLLNEIMDLAKHIFDKVNAKAIVMPAATGVTNDAS